MNRFAPVAMSLALGFTFQIRLATAATEKVIYAFCSQQNCSDGSGPVGALITDGKNNLYGTTSGGGDWACGCGTVFKLEPDGTEVVLHSFGPDRDGNSPTDALIRVKGTLYGTTLYGGEYEYYGTVFSVDLATGAETVLHSFHWPGDGYYPYSALVNIQGTLYGTTQWGGNRDGAEGTVFSINPANGVENVLYSFCQQENCADGAELDAGVIKLKGMLYGTSGRGGAAGYGAVFSVDPTTGAETVLHSFQEDGVDGEVSRAGLLNVNGMLYGTTIWGGKYERGTVFSINPVTGAETVVYSFGSHPGDGADPFASLIDVNGTLYGTTGTGGGTGCDGWGCGTVFSLNPGTGAEKVLYSFCSQQACADGSIPSAALIYVNGALYGTTATGGNEGCYGNGCGTVFKIML